jgi:hypothetical protein
MGGEQWVAIVAVLGGVVTATASTFVQLVTHGDKQKSRDAKWERGLASALRQWAELEKFMAALGVDKQGDRQYFALMAGFAPGRDGKWRR